MDEIKLKDEYVLFVPGCLDEDDLFSMIKKLTGKNIKNRFGLKDSYMIILVDESGEYKESLEIDIIKNNNIYTTKISQIIEGMRRDGKEIYESKPEIIDLLSSKLNGLILLKRFEVNNYCKLKESRYGIKYESNSVDYKLLDFCINKLNNEIEAMTLFQLIKDNKTELIDILHV